MTVTALSMTVTTVSFAVFLATLLVASTGP
jgi:hypothetical protein